MSTKSTNSNSNSNSTAAESSNKEESNHENSTAPPTTERRPDRTTMKGMIWNANHVLDQALSPDTNGLPKVLFENCEGLLLLSIIEAGFCFTGNVGTGILLAKTKTTTSSSIAHGWSPPCAMGLTGVGWGFVVGASLKDLVVFLMDQTAVDTLATDNSIKFGGQASLTLGAVGRDGAVDLEVSGRGVGATVAIAYSKGVFGGIAVEGAMVGARHAVNEAYYRKEVHPREILFHPNAVTIPDDNNDSSNLMPEIYKKLHLLAQGKTHTPDSDEVAKVEEARTEADKAGEEAAKTMDNVEYVDASVKAAQESSDAESTATD